MPILEQLCHAFKQAIIDYEKEMEGDIPLKRQPIVAELRTLLEDYLQDECHRMVWLNDQETLPTLPKIDKSTIYFIQNYQHLHAYWYAHGVIEKAVIQAKNRCEQIKNAFDNCTIEKFEEPILFNTVIVLSGYRNRKRDSLLLRAHMLAYLKTMPATRFVFIVWASRLQIKLQTVLDHPHFGEFQLSVAERGEITARQHLYDSEIQSLKAQINLLQDGLRQEQAKDSVQKVNALTLELAQEKKKTAFLTQENKQLQQSVDKLFTECSHVKTAYQTLSREKATLQANYDDLHAKYQALLQEKQSQEQPKEQIAQGFWG